MTPLILLARHGETDSNAARVMQLPDARLSAAGRSQAERLAARVAGLGVAQILCSDLTRARQTAAPIAARCGLPVTLDPLLRERDFGDLRGTPHDELRMDPFAADYVPPNGESWSVFHARVARAWALITKTASRAPGTLLVVTHGFVCRAIAQRHLHLDENEPIPERWHNTALTWVEAAHPWKVRRLHCIEHLNEDRRPA